MWKSQEIEWLDIELTSFCNIKCPGCLRQVKGKDLSSVLDKDYLTYEKIRKWIVRENFPNLKLINFCGSVDEPTLHPEILDIIDYFIPEVDINLASNGSTKTKEFWKKLGQRKISVFFGIDGVDQKSLEKYRIGSNYKKVVENFRAFIDAGGLATWQFIVFDHNEHLIEQARKISEDEGFKNFRLIYSHRSDNNEVNKIKREENKEIVCKYANQKRMFLSHTGGILPCCFLNSEYLQSYAGGPLKTDFIEKYEEFGRHLSNNLNYNKIDEILDGDLFNYVIDSWKKNPITRCSKTCKKAQQDVFLDSSEK